MTKYDKPTILNIFGKAALCKQCRYFNHIIQNVKIEHDIVCTVKVLVILLLRLKVGIKM